LDNVDESLNVEFERENRSESQVIKEASSLANGIVVITDLLVSNVAGAFSGGNKEDYKLSDSEKSAANDAWAKYLAEKNVELSPGLMLIIVMGLIVVPKFVAANRERKERKLQKSQENKVLELETEIKTLNKKLKDATAKSSQM